MPNPSSKEISQIFRYWIRCSSHYIDNILAYFILLFDLICCKTDSRSCPKPGLCPAVLNVMVSQDATIGTSLMVRGRLPRLTTVTCLETVAINQVEHRDSLSYSDFEISGNPLFIKGVNGIF